MKTLSKIGLSLSALLLASEALAGVTIYEREGFRGRAFAAAGNRPVWNLRSQGFNEGAASAIVAGNRTERWEVCDDRAFRGNCTVLRAGEYPSLAALGLNDRIASARSIPPSQRVADDRYAPLPGGEVAASKIEFFAREGFGGRRFSVDGSLADFRDSRFDDRASSAVVTGGNWEICTDPGFAGRCTLLRPGQYASLASLGFDGQISSARAVSRNAPPPPAPPPAQPNQIVFYEHEQLRGGSLTASGPVADMRGTGMDDRASSVVVTGAPWEVCPQPGFGGRCVVLQPGQHPSLVALGLDDRISSARIYAAPVPAPQPTAGQISFYEADGFQGRSFTAEGPVSDLRRIGFDNRTSSVVVRGNLSWEVCDDQGFSGRCVTLPPGQYPSLAAMGMNDQITSVRALVPGADPRPLPLRGDYRPRDNERLYQANVSMVRAVLADNSGQRCWVERSQGVTERADPNVQGAVLGAVLGGILGHQIGGGSGRDVATGLGVVAGAAIGANVGRREGNVVQTQDVQRCSTAPAQARAAYYDVTYEFRGQEFRVQMSEAPGSTITVNERGEPRA